MTPLPPPLPGTKSPRLASALNVFLPGAGLIYLGRKRAGGILAAAFLFCFFALMTLFLVAYARYLQLALSDDLLKGDKLESVGQLFPRGWIVAFTVAGLVIYVISAVLLARAKRNTSPQSAL